MKKQMIAALAAILLVSCGSETTGTSSAPSQTASIEETVILDQGGLKITATGLEESFMGEEVNYSDL